MQFKTLENTGIELITDVFNKAFSDYFIPVHFNPDQLTAKMKRDNVLLHLSVGVFEGDQLLAFILHAYDFKDGIAIAYNAGTGVLKEMRGRQLTQKMYTFILPILKNEGIRKIVLEVIEGNIAACLSYEKTGFIKGRNLLCFNGKPIRQNLHQPCAIERSYDADLSSLNAFGDWLPAWQNEITHYSYRKDERDQEPEKKQIIPDHLEFIIVKDERKIPAGYAFYNPSNGNILQFAVSKAYRRQGYGTALFSYIATRCKGQVILLNIEDEPGTTNFLQSIGLTQSIRQYEMSMDL